jgi:hypothetical protein
MSGNNAFPALPSYDEQMRELSAQQHGVVGRAQLLEIGSARKIERRLASGVIIRRFHSVYVLAGVAKCWKQDLMAACFAGGKLSAASFRAGAALWYLPGAEELLEVTSPRRRRSRHAGVIPHESHYLGAADLAYVDNIPVLRPARIINDFGLLVERGELSDQVLDQAMHEAVRRDLVSIASVWGEWQRLGGAFRPGGEAVEEMLKRFVPTLRKTDSTGESRLLQLMRAAGLPEPVPQFRVWRSETSWFDLDFAFPDVCKYAEFDPYKYHGDRDRYMRMEARRLELRDLGWDGVSVTDDELDAGAQLALRVLKGLLSRAS